MEHRINKKRRQRYKMKVKCLKCEQVKELNSSELEEVGTFVENRKLRAVGFLKFLSLDMRELCKDGKEHQWEFEQEFDKQIHILAKDVKDTKGVVNSSKAEEIECLRIIEEITAKREMAKQRIIENEAKTQKLLENMKEIVYIKDETLWS